jgi:hypothetical protein
MKSSIPLCSAANISISVSVKVSLISPFFGRNIFCKLLLKLLCDFSLVSQLYVKLFSFTVLKPALKFFPDYIWLVLFNNESANQEETPFS